MRVPGSPLQVRERVGAGRGVGVAVGGTGVFVAPGGGVVGVGCGVAVHQDAHALSNWLAPVVKVPVQEFLYTGLLVLQPTHSLYWKSLIHTGVAVGLGAVVAVGAGVAVAAGGLYQQQVPLGAQMVFGFWVAGTQFVGQLLPVKHPNCNTES